MKIELCCYSSVSLHLFVGSNSLRVFFIEESNIWQQSAGYLGYICFNLAPSRCIQFPDFPEVALIAGIVLSGEE